MGSDTTRRRVVPTLEANAMSLLISRVVAAGATTAVFAIAAHQLSTRDFGLVASILAAGFLANSLVTFGTDTLITREVAAGGASALTTAKSALRLQLTGAAALILLAAAAWALGASALLVAQAVVLVPQAIVTVAGAVLRGWQKMVPLATSGLIGAAVSLSATVGGFAIETTPLVPVVALGLGALAAAFSLALAAGRSAPVSPDRAAPRPPVTQARLLRTTAPFAAMVVLAAVGAQGGLLLVEFMTDEPTGGYGAAVRLTEAGRLVPAAVIGAFFPAMLGGAHRTERYRRWMWVLTGYTIVATALLVAAAGLINRVLFDSQPDGAALIRLLALSLVFTLARLALSFEAIAEGRLRRVVISALAGTAVLLGLGLTLAGPWGARGVAVAQVAGVVAATSYLGVGWRRSPAPGSSPVSLIDMGKPITRRR